MQKLSGRLSSVFSPQSHRVMGSFTYHQRHPPVNPPGKVTTPYSTTTRKSSDIPRFRIVLALATTRMKHNLAPSPWKAHHLSRLV
jgi:hypothetical protein